jgi:hypothetical protein
MKHPLKSNSPAKLARGRRCFERWRSTHKPYTRLPERLWSLAVELAHEYGLSRTSRTLRLDYNCLKKQVEFRVSDDASPAIPTPPFLELIPSGTDSTIECTIECEDAKGAKIRIHLKGRELPDLSALSSSLWSPNR